MQKTTVYLPEELDHRLEAEARATGLSKAELIRRGVTSLLDASERPRKAKPFPVLKGGGPMTLEQMDHELVEQLEKSAARR